MRDRVRIHLSYYRPRDWAPQNRILLVDEDGQWFINYLEASRADDNNPGVLAEHAGWLATHRKGILHEQQTATKPDVVAKFNWLAAYHNYVAEHLYPEMQHLRIGGVAARAFRRLSDLGE